MDIPSIPQTLARVATGDFGTVRAIPRLFPEAARTELRSVLHAGADELEPYAAALTTVGDAHRAVAATSSSALLFHLEQSSAMYNAAANVKQAVAGLRLTADGSMPRGTRLGDFQGVFDARKAADYAVRYVDHARERANEYAMAGGALDQPVAVATGQADGTLTKPLGAVTGQGSAAYPTFGSITGATLPAFEAPEWRRIETTPAPFADRARRIGGDIDAMRRMAARVGDVALNSAERNRHAKAAAALLDHVLSDLDVLKLQVGGEVPDADIAKFVTSDVERTHATLLKLRTNTIGVAEGDVVEARFPDQAKFGKAIASWNSARDAIELAAVPAHEPAVAAPAGGMPEVI